MFFGGEPRLLAKQAASVVMQRADINKDGNIGAKEFIRWFKANAGGGASAANGAASTALVAVPPPPSAVRSQLIQLFLSGAVEGSVNADEFFSQVRAPRTNAVGNETPRFERVLCSAPSSSCEAQQPHLEVQIL